ncbi:hypothetical protein EH165_07040 [Nakamurella antarctica]|uniref:Uncharacterized protein n=1 Tax=Nakamurella antarctica TaxID=1902245 RepID=A0A3G8ZW93_9ACTN|nr:hypothetical protein [Nakamurella antarctica]AZI57931.1 hypothetical protein EH165_07040 [Nakamurella antarctica]
MAFQDRSKSMRSWWKRNGLVVAASITVVVGSVVYLLAPTPLPTFVWTAYAPLSSNPDYSQPTYFTDQHLIGAVLAVLGLIMLAGAVGFRLGLTKRAP